MPTEEDLERAKECLAYDPIKGPDGKLIFNPKVSILLITEALAAERARVLESEEILGLVRALRNHRTDHRKCLCTKALVDFAAFSKLQKGDE